ncbi:MAG: Uma2 family endonuclease [Syntrophomonadaceae bacterium]|nr:Uma2 family endonuclease [Syntrophomonadaceae bacterium]
MGLSFTETASAREKIYTYEDYQSLPEGAPYQLIGGELILTPAPSIYHQIISGKLQFKLRAFVTEQNLGLILYAPVDVYLGETETFQPDILFIAKERMGIVEPARINGAPDLVVEILSPATAYYDLRKKFKVYERYGVKEYWIVDTEDKSVQVFVHRDGKLVLDQESGAAGEVYSRLLSGFFVHLDGIFEDQLS